MENLRKSRLLAVVITASAIILSGLQFPDPAEAHGGATGVVKERMKLMKSLGKRMKRMRAMVKGRIPMDTEVFASSAGEIAESAPDIIRVFPEGSLEKPTEALPQIWEEWDRFSAITERLVEEASDLAEVALEGDRRDIEVRFARLGETCSSCHTDFRKD